MPSLDGLRRAVLVAAALGISACSPSARGPQAAISRFPIGIYAVNDPKYLARLKQDGFDSVQTFIKDSTALAAMAREARRQGLRLVIAPDQLRGVDVALTRGWPVDAWYLYGEPETHHVSSATLRTLSDQTRAWDPVRPQAIDIGKGSAVKVYGAIPDIVLMDWYPVPHLRTDSVADQADTVVDALPPGKRFWFIVQAYDWADEVTDPVKLSGLRFPNRSEIRFMSYLAVMHGARGLFYFALSKKDKTLFDYPELWQAVSSVALEMRSIRPVFERGQLAPLPFPADPDGPEARCWVHGGRRYVVVANRSRDGAVRMPDVLLTPEWRPLFEPRRDAHDLLEKRPDGSYLKPYDVMVFESRWHLRL